MRTITTEELKKILEEHRKWLENPMAGKIADLRNANLRDADLCGANLYGANLRGADLCGANLRGANLCGANLCGANLRNTDLHNADLRDANLRGANLHNADLHNADLRDANLRGANLRVVYLRNADLCDANLRGANVRDADLCGANVSIPLACPEKGGFTGWKVALVDDSEIQCIVEIYIPADAKRSSATSRKCRANKAKVISITSIDGETSYETAYSDYDNDFIYRVGEYAEVENFDKNRFHECAPGIHFFITRQEAVDYAEM